MYKFSTNFLFIYLLLKLYNRKSIRFPSIVTPYFDTFYCKMLI